MVAPTNSTVAQECIAPPAYSDLSPSSGGIGNTSSSLHTLSRYETPPTSFIARVQKVLSFCLEKISALFSFIKGLFSTPEPQSPSAKVYIPKGLKQGITACIPVEHESKIGTLFTTLASASVFEMLWQKAELTTLGKEIESIPPLSLLAFLLKNYREELKTLKSQPQKWSRVLEEFTKKMRLPSSSSEEVFKAFAEDRGVSYQALHPYKEQFNWDEMIAYLMTQPEPMVAIQQETNAAPLPFIELSTEQKNCLGAILYIYKKQGMLEFYTNGPDWKSLKNPHPLAMLDHLFSTDSMRVDLEVIFRRQAVGNWFKNALVTTLAAYPFEKVKPQVFNFCRRLKITDEFTQRAVIDRIYAKDWDSLIEYLRNLVQAKEGSSRVAEKTSIP